MVIIQLITGILPIALWTVIKIILSLRVKESSCNLCDIPETENEILYLYVPYMAILEQRFFILWLVKII